jgi:hypothetical protein
MPRQAFMSSLINSLAWLGRQALARCQERPLR